jgi:hypothetical protein
VAEETVLVVEARVRCQGMPATVMMTAEERTALDYLISPFVASFDRSFRQR